MPLFFSTRRAASGFMLMIGLSVALAGCASRPPEPAAQTQQTTYVGVMRGMTSPGKTIRYDRYTILSTLPRTDQVQLLDQIIDIRIPDTLAPSVQQAMIYTLRQSGYRLCPGTGEVALLFSHPLPASHYKLGPITVRDALQTLAGPAWTLKVDDLTRSICFAVQDEYQRPAPSIPASKPPSSIAGPSLLEGAK